MPSQLYPFARALVEGHTHTARKYGTEFIETFTWGEMCEEVKSIPRREAAQRSTRRLPKAAFGAYKSATLHTIKRRLPVKLFALPGALIVGGLAIWFAVKAISPDAVAANVGAADSASAEPAPHSKPQSGKLTYTTAEDYAVAMTPRISRMPWTAPAFDGRQVQSDPRVFCALSAPGEDANGVMQEDESCHCLTEQGTKYAMPPAECRALALNGEAYNPFRPDRSDRGGPGSRDGKETGGNAPARAPQAVHGAGSASEQQATYGAFRSS
jgi:hypothetical protein